MPGQAPDPAAIEGLHVHEKFASIHFRNPISLNGLGKFPAIASPKTPSHMNTRAHRITPLLAVAAFLLTSTSSLLAQTTGYQVDASSHAGGAGGDIVGIFSFILGIATLIGMWKLFTKAGQPGWASIIPIYNTYILCKIVGKPGWWVLLFFIPLVNLIIAVILMVGLARSFGKGTGFGIGLVFLSFIFIPILGFGDATYQGPSA